MKLTDEMIYALKCWNNGSGTPRHKGFRLSTAQALIKRGLLNTASGLPLRGNMTNCVITGDGVAALRQALEEEQR